MNPLFQGFASRYQDGGVKNAKGVNRGFVISDRRSFFVAGQPQCFQHETNHRC